MRKIFINFIILSAISVTEINSNNCYCRENVITDTDSGIIIYNYPRSIPTSPDFIVTVNNQKTVVVNTSAGPFISFSCSGKVEIDITMINKPVKLNVSPSVLAITPEVKENHVVIRMNGPNKFALMSDRTPLLYIYANPFPTNVPDASDPKVKYFKAGQVYEIGELHLASNETLYIEGGAVVRGCVMASSAENVRISGYGILDGSYYNSNDKHRSIIYEGCKNSVVENIIMIEPTTWMIVLGCSEHITVRNVKELGFVMTSDGVDVVGSSHIRVENCFFRNCDDCIAIKSFDMKRYNNNISLDWNKNVEDIEVTGCILWSYGGQVFEIGHELTTESVNNIRFRDCDAIVHSYGSVFGIHNADWAAISNVLFENIRVEHYYNKLVDLRIIKTKYSGKGPGNDNNRGQIRNVTLRNIDVKVTPFNLGISLSHIGGYDAKHMIQNVTFENFVIDGVKITNADQMELYIKQATGIIFR